jgi:putative ABC transport system substrate-binding protein
VSGQSVVREEREDQVRRREFILGVACVAGAWPFAAAAQTLPDRIRRVAVLRYADRSDPEDQELLAAFMQQLKSLGWIDGGNVVIETLWARGPDELRSNTAQLITRTPDVIVAAAAAVRPALDATRDTPIVFVNINDPVGLGLVPDLAHPGGNITGFYNYDFGMAGKWLETLKEIAPGVSRVALVGNRDIPSYDGWVRAAQDSAASFGVEIVAPALRAVADIEPLLDQLSHTPSGLLILPDSFVSLHRNAIIAAAKRFRLPAIYPRPFYSKAGGLLSYGIDLADIYRRAATYADRILKGANPGELPVQGPTKFELVINLATARELGLPVPQRLRLLADQLIG